MKRKKTIRTVIDVIMTILLFASMGYYITGNNVHEILGISLFVLFLIHNLLNIKWYKTIWKGKHTIESVFHIVMNLLLLVALIGMMISSIMISTNVLGFINISATMLGRKLHMLFHSWLFILVAIHIGLHLNGFIIRINSKMKKNTFEYVYYLFVFLLLLLCFGIYAFISNGLWKDMFLLNEYKYFDYDKHYIVFYLEYLSIIFSVSIMTHNILLLVRKRKKRKDGTNE